MAVDSGEATEVFSGNGVNPLTPGSGQADIIGI